MHVAQDLADALELSQCERRTHVAHLRRGKLHLARIALRRRTRRIAGIVHQQPRQHRIDVFEDTGFLAGVDLLPYRKPLFGVDRLDQTGDLCGMHRAQTLAHALVLATVQRLDDGRNLGA